MKLLQAKLAKYDAPKKPKRQEFTLISARLKASKIPRFSSTARKC